MKRDTINILCATDDNYVPYCGVMLTSVLENNKDIDVHVFIIIDRDLNESNKKQFTQLAKYYHVQITYILVNKKDFEEFPLHPEQHFTTATYYRLAAELLLPQNIEKVIYLDCDMVVNSSLLPLWRTNIEKYSVAVVDDMCIGLTSNYERLKYSPSLKYFNAGMLLINLHYWRKNNLFQKFKQYATKYSDRLLWNDQDLLNAVLLENKLHVGIEWNYQMGFLKQSYFDTLPAYLQSEIRTTQPKIIHYNQSKPWNVAYYNLPYNDIWHHYKRLSPWKMMCDIYPSHKKLNYFIKRWLLWPLGFMIQTDTIQL